MKIFLKQLILFASFISLLFVLIYLLVYIVFKNEITSVNKALYYYQVNKVKRSDSVKIAFLGDSSLGNSLNSKLFSKKTNKKTINVALTGSYGYAGSYNMLKKIIKYNKSIETVILVQTINISQRRLAWDGYARTMSKDDFKELNISQKLQVINTLINVKNRFSGLISQLLFKKEYTDYIENDYIKQTKDKRVDKNAKGFDTCNINNKKYLFLKKIKQVCKKNEIKLIYAHGPIFEGISKQSESFIKRINKNISSIEIELLDTIFSVPYTELGDSEDHVKPSLKNEYTLKWVKVLKDKI